MLRGLHFPEVDLQTVKRRVGRGLENLVRQSVGEEFLEKGIELFKASYDRTHLQGTFLLPGVPETLERLHKRGIKMAVASNKPVEFTKSILQHLNLEQYFDESIGPGDGVRPKPHPSMLRTLMGRMAVTTDETVYVGDMPLDAETATAASVELILIASGGYTIDELRPVQASYVLSSMNELEDIV
jgi:HAD superfamily hydrolase (TIGR01509 family)